MKKSKADLKFDMNNAKILIDEEDKQIKEKKNVKKKKLNVKKR